MERARVARGLGGTAASETALAAQGTLAEPPGDLLSEHTSQGQAPGEHRSGPGTQKGAA
jgi:hypothetical protein